jgi:hypothetical protein
VLIANVLPGEYDVPEPFAAVFHPENVNPVLANTGEPEFPKIVTVDPAVYGEEASVGVFPLVLVLPLYVTVYIDGVFLTHEYALLSLANPDLFLPGIYYVYYIIFI